MQFSLLVSALELTLLARENSSAYSSLLSKVLPTTLSASDSDGGGVGVEVRFVREIVWPDGRREVEGVTPKALPAPDRLDATCLRHED